MGGYVGVMPTALTPTQSRVEALLGRSLRDYVIEKRTGRGRWTWREIADQLADDIGPDNAVSHEVLRKWYGDEAAA